MYPCNYHGFLKMIEKYAKLSNISRGHLKFCSIWHFSKEKKGFVNILLNFLPLKTQIICKMRKTYKPLLNGPPRKLFILVNVILFLVRRFRDFCEIWLWMTNFPFLDLKKSKNLQILRLWLLIFFNHFEKTMRVSWTQFQLSWTA